MGIRYDETGEEISLTLDAHTSHTYAVRQPGPGRALLVDTQRPHRRYLICQHQPASREWVSTDHVRGDTVLCACRPNHQWVYLS
jgi:hypothetical protein